MKSYSSSELSRIIEDLQEKSNMLQEKANKLEESRKAVKFLDFKSKNTINQEIEVLNGLIYSVNYAIIMLHLYADSLRTDYNNSMPEEDWIQCEKEAEAGDGLSKLQIFCHKCFVEHTIVHRDIKRLEMEAEAGVSSSAYILEAYNAFFAD